MTHPSTLSSRAQERASTTALRLSPGDLLGARYEVVGLLGRGGMGEVYAAFDSVLERQVAVKVAPHRLLTRSVALQRFQVQARLAARVCHPGAVQVYDSGLDPLHGPFVVMESLEGQTVDELLMQHGKLDPGLAVELVLQACRVLSAAHRAFVVHRDVKPSNLFLVSGTRDQPWLARPGTRFDSPMIARPRESFDVQLKVLDFGLARMLASEATLTRSRETFGTLAYVAPEQLRSAKSAGPAADVYALGCVLFELLTGRPPFRQAQRCMLRESVLRDPPIDPCLLQPQLPAALGALVLRTLSKEPALRPESMAELELLLGEVARGLAQPRLSVSSRPLAAHGARFRIGEQLGSGAHGDVYAAVDLASGRSVALKRIRDTSGQALLKLERELRQLADLHHPNLVRIDEIWVENGQAFLCMERVEGLPFLEHVRAADGRLTPALEQLCAGLDALHRAGLSHQDLKSSNILVERTGRVVLLDFGSADQQRTHRRSADSSEGSGERFADSREAKADMLALGSLLHEALTGLPPLGRYALDVERGAACDPELWSLCTALLQTNASARPSAAEAHDRLAGGRAQQGTLYTRFVGREHELARLKSGFRSACAGSFSALLVSGPSGIGKTELLRRLRDVLPPALTWLPGRCRDVAGPPFPALVSAVDALCDQLRALPGHAVRELLPTQLGALARLFPALLEVDAVAQVALDPLPTSDGAQLRTQAYDALRELLQRVCRRGPVVLVIDDVQWLDGDSRALLSYVLRGPEPPPLLLVATLRAGEGEQPRVAVRTAPSWLPVVPEQLALQPLSLSECEALLDAPSGDARAQLAHAHEQAHGHPLYLTSLLSTRAHRPTLEQALLLVYRERSPEAQRVLQLVSIASRPLPRASVLRAANPDTHDRGVAVEARPRARERRSASAPHVLRELVGLRLLAELPSPAGSLLEPYHAAVRDAVAATLSSEERRCLHRELAECLALDDLPELLLEHVAAAGAPEQAVAQALVLAHRAEQDLAFGRAVALFEVALAHLPGGDVRRPELLLARARALRNAGQTRQAGLSIWEVASASSGATRARLSAEAIDAFVMSGDLELGLGHLQTLDSSFVPGLPADALSAVGEAMRALLALRARGLGYTERDPEQIADSELTRLDLSLSLAQGLSHADLRGLPLAFRALQGALEAGDLTRLQRAAAIFVWNTGSHFPNDQVEPALALCRTLTTKLATPHARALLLAAEAEHLHVHGQFLASGAACERAEHILSSECHGAGRVLASVRASQAFLQYAHKGDFRGQVDETMGWLAAAALSGDVYHHNMLRAAHALVWIARDEPERARSELHEAEASWPAGCSIFEVSLVLFLDVADRYEQRDAATLQAAQGRASVLQSPMAHMPMLLGYLCLHRAWCALRLLASEGADSRQRSTVVGQIATLRKLALEIWKSVADALEANLAQLEGEHERALVLLAQAEQGLRALYMPCLAACARQRRGELTGGLVGGRIEREALRELQDLGVARPQRWCRAYFSPFAVESRRGPATLHDTVD